MEEEQVVASTMDLQHPYYPLGLQLPGYEAPTMPFERVLAIFFGGCAVVFLVLIACTRSYGKAPGLERGIACWFVVTGIIHFVIEGFVVVTPDYFKDTSGNILAEIWKEYTKADSRYATRDAFVIAMEAVTAFVEGPACLMVAFALLNGRPWRYWSAILVSLGQVYGDVLYFATCGLEGAVHTRPEWLYFWFYFIVVNGIWIAIPGSVIAYCVGHITAAQALADGKMKSA